MSSTSWKQRLTGQIAPELEEEVDRFASQIQLRQQGRMDEKVFAETRLRRGVYGQRYDNGQRYDGRETRALAFPCGGLTKGPTTVWDAPGMVRIKIPYGGLNARQLEVIAELAEEYSDDILHVTTRQDIQLHFVHIEDTADLMYRLAAVGITTREACGNSVRNVTGCPTAGVCTGEAFDTTPYTEAVFEFLLGHKDAQDFGRKFKIAVSGCAGEACALAMMHDAGLVAALRDGKRGFAVYVGGGLGSVPEQAQLLSDFVSEEELLPILQCVCRIFGRMGEKKLRHKARLKFLLRDLGIEKFRELVAEERKILPHDPRWTSYLKELRKAAETPLLPPAPLPVGTVLPPGFAEWRATNVKAQKQAGYSIAKVTMPLGDFTPDQARALADLARRYVGETTGIRLTVDQNFVFRYIPEARLPELYAGLAAVGLAEAGADTIIDITSCPGTDTCKLGTASSRGLAGALRQHLANRWMELDTVVRGLHIKVSGCFNSCGQHHIADLGFYGVTRKRHGKSVPHFQIFLGGTLEGNASAFGLAAVAVPAKRIPTVVDRYTEFYAKNRQAGEGFKDFVARIGKAKFRDMLQDLTEVPVYEEAPELFTDWRDPREYGTGDIGIGECAGEVVNTVDFDLAEAERILFQAQLALEAGRLGEAAAQADDAMFKAAKGLIYTRFVDITADRGQIVREFRARLVEPKHFHDPFAGDKFAQYFLDAAAKPLDGKKAGDVHRRIEEAGLFIEAAHTCADKLATPAA